MTSSGKSKLTENSENAETKEAGWFLRAAAPSSSEQGDKKR